MGTIFAGLVKNVLGIVWNWMSGYNKPKAVEARRIQDENKKKDELNESLQKLDIDDVRRKLP